MNEAISPRDSTLAAAVKDLPALPEVVTELIATMEQSDVDLGSVARKLGRDQALTGKVLRLANSPFFGLQGRIGTVHDAITVLGLRAVRSLVVACGVQSALQPPLIRGFDAHEFWNHAFESAVAARTLAHPMIATPDAAFLAGLLHDVGKLAISVLDPEGTERLAAYAHEYDCCWHCAEVNCDMAEHAHVGAALASRWNFPESLCEAIWAHHTPSLGCQRLAAVIHVADIIVYAMSAVFDPKALAPLVDIDAWIEAGSDADRVGRAVGAVLRIRQNGGSVL